MNRHALVWNEQSWRRQQQLTKYMLVKRKPHSAYKIMVQYASETIILLVYKVQKAILLAN